mmetsp:Transcript_7338/g.9589  ORF Transcript_7338/g.9589 Transcript_7338/m.9589 type:complete len:392 (-) Transcript_7338:429-1604(-)
MDKNGCCKPACTLPGRTERAVELLKSQEFAPLGDSWKEGPTHKFSLSWLFCSYSGLVYLQFYLWLIKDWSWSQLHWFWPGMISGSLALLHGLFLIVAALFVGAISESLVAIGLFLWLFANYWWMIGEFWQYEIDLDSPKWVIPKGFEQNLSQGRDAFYDKQTEEAKILSMVALVWLSLVVFVFPLCFNDRGSKFIRKITFRTPPPRFQLWFRDWIEYETLHVLSWSFKDTMWIWGSVAGYSIGFIITLVLTVDIIWVLWSHSGQWIDLFHYFAVSLWIFANGVWAIGELMLESPNEDIIPDKAWEDYSFIPPPSEITYFWGRNMAGYFFLFATLDILCFYAYWVCFAKISPPFHSSPNVSGSGETDHLGFSAVVGQPEALEPSGLTELAII